MRRPALTGVMMATALALGAIALGPPALADRNPRVSSVDYVDCDDIRGWIVPRFTECRGDGAKTIEATFVRCSDLKRDVAATLSECVMDTRGGGSGKSAGKGGNGPGKGGNGGSDDGGDDNGGGSEGPSASASAGGSGSTATANSGSGPKASASVGPGGPSSSASSGSGSVSAP